MTSESNDRQNEKQGAHSDLTEGQTFGKYQIRKKIGSGGMGNVYLARHTRLERNVALKILSDRIASRKKFRKLFEQEALTLAKMDHPGIVTIHDMDEEEGRFYIEMEYIRGPSLKKLIKHSSRPPLDRVLSAFSQLSDALAYAHDRGVIHRDIKPGNILLEDGETPKIADFGIAQIVRPDVEEPKVHVSGGTPKYMAPEQQSKSGKADHRADLFSLGLVMYEWATGNKPASFPPDPPSDVVDVDERLDDLLFTCLNTDPSERYQTAEKLHNEVRNRISSISETFQSVSVTEFLEFTAERYPPVVVPLLMLTGATALGSLLTVYLLSGVLHGAMALQLIRYLRDDEDKPDVRKLLETMDQGHVLLALFILQGVGVSFGLVLVVLPGLALAAAWMFSFLFAVDPRYRDTNEQASWIDLPEGISDSVRQMIIRPVKALSRSWRAAVRIGFLTCLILVSPVFLLFVFTYFFGWIGVLSHIFVGPLTLLIAAPLYVLSSSETNLQD